MYGAGINRGLAGFVSQGRKKKKQSAISEFDEITLTTTEKIPENDYRIIGVVFGTANGEEKMSAHEQAIKVLRDKAKQMGADVVVAMRFESTSSTVTAYGTAVKIVK
ncbi:MAG: selenium-binding protein [Lactobacillus sp.]|nr:selenium-binding protein [Lactobacillus sp.]